MQPQEISRAISGVIDQFRAHPDDAKSEDKPAKALLESGLRVRIEGQAHGGLRPTCPLPLEEKGQRPHPAGFGEPPRPPVRQR